MSSLDQLEIVQISETFVCHICEKGSLIPKEVITKVNYQNDFIGNPVTEKITDWNAPGDMQKCACCHKWSCSEHVHNGMCNVCARK